MAHFDRVYPTLNVQWSSWKSVSKLPTVVYKTYSLCVLSFIMKLCNTCILPSSCMALSAGQLPREMHTRLMLSINDVCESC